MRTLSVFYIIFFLSSYTLLSQTISTVRMLNLSEYNLAKLGIKISGEGVFYNENSMANKNSKNISRKIILTKNSIKVKSTSKNELDDIQPFAPIFAVNVFKNGSAVFYNQSKDLQYHFDSTGALKNENTDANPDWINQLVCISIEFSPKSSNKKIATKNTAYLWYKVSTQFLEALPLDVAEPIWSEMFTPEQAIENSPKGRYTDSWRGTNELLNTKPLFPNPANESTTLEFSLSSTSILSISLYDITGQKIKDFSNNQQYQQGNNTYNIPLDGLSEGMYLVVINPKGAEPAVQRLIIVK